MRKSILNMLTLLIVAAIPAQAAWAQSVEDSERSGVAAVLMDEVLVTARKKGVLESVQDVPIAVTAFSADQLEAMFAADLQDITGNVPNAAATESGTFANYVNFNVRGMGVAGTVISDDPAVGVFVDGVYMGVSFGILLDSFDLESVEILRGPQGTLFGRNVTAGAAVVRTKGPSDELEGGVRVIAGNNGRQEIAARVSGPMSDTVAGKLAVFYKSNDDYMDNPSGNALGFDDLGEREQTVIRGALRFEPSDNFSADFRVEIGDSSDDPLPISAIDNAGLLGAQPIPGVSELVAEDSDDPIANGVNLEPADSEWQNVALEMSWNIGGGTLTSLTAWRDFEQTGLSQDFDGSIVQLFDVNNSFVEQDQVSQEFLYNIDLGERTSLTAGLYFFDQSWEYGERRFGILFAPFGTGTDPVLGAPTGGLHAHGFGDHSVTGIFAQAEIDLTDQWILTVGGRYSEEDKEIWSGQFGAGLLDGSNNCTDLVSTDPRDCPPNFTGSEDWGSFTPKVGIQYLASEDTQFYGSYSRGFRSGGFNVRQNAGQVPGPYDEETVNAFEFGVKSDLADGRFRINAAVFMNEFEDLQRTVVNEAGFQTVSNAAEATVTGLEVEANWLVTDTFLVQIASGFIDSEINNFVNPRGGPGGAPLVIDGTSLPFAADSQHSVGLTYDVPLNSGDLTFRASYQFFDETESTDDNLGFPSESYDVTNASVTFSRSNWRLTAFGRNLSDGIRNEQITSAINPGWILQGGRLPASYGVEFSIDFLGQ